ncbi:MAG TPA: PHB depolymerase family esterase [Ktedonobacteraceae bacterium]|nr:PHB depolymerase family esterase [Ktedonobacteraceae bacterium]
MKPFDRRSNQSRRTGRLLLLSGITFSLLVILTFAVYAVATLAHNHLPQGVTAQSSPVVKTHATPTESPITCTTPQHAAGNSNNTITSGGLQRTFLLHLPPSYGRQPQPLVINYHGYTETTQVFAQYSNMAVESDKAGFILVFPQGEDNPTTWNAGIGAYGPTGDANDVQFTHDLLRYLEKNYCVDAQRIYVAGYSIGGGMAYRVACNLSTQIAAFATVEGAFYTAPGGCHPAHPVPVLEIHGQADRYAPYTGNPPLLMAAVQPYLNNWLDWDKCSNTTQTFFKQDDVTGIEWPHCADGTVVAHYIISDGGHTWPGATPRPSLGFTTHTIDANAVIWDFFKQFSS